MPVFRLKMFAQLAILLSTYPTRSTSAQEETKCRIDFNGKASSFLTPYSLQLGSRFIRWRTTIAKHREKQYLCLILLKEVYHDRPQNQLSVKPRRPQISKHIMWNYFVFKQSSQRHFTYNIPHVECRGY